MFTNRQTNPIQDVILSRYNSLGHLFWYNIAAATLLSLLTNVMYLALPIFTNQVYGRVLASESVGTLIVLSLLTITVFGMGGVIDYLRDRLMGALALTVDHKLASDTFSSIFENPGNRSEGKNQIIRDLDLVRQTLSGPAMSALFDLPWMPVFMVILFYVNLWIGLITLLGSMLLLLLAVIQERTTSSALSIANASSLRSYSFTDLAIRNSETVQALGMMPQLKEQWATLRSKSLKAGAQAAQRNHLFTGLIRLFRVAIQVIVIAVGALLVIQRSISPAILFANMILAARALAPIERIVASWKLLFETQVSVRRLRVALSAYIAPLHVTQLPPIIGSLDIDNVTLALDGRVVLLGVSFHVSAGEMVGIIGPSGAGKSTLARIIGGLWKPSGGTARLDGADVVTTNRSDLSRLIGFQPQETELFPGTVRDNIARFRTDADDAAVIAAAKAAGSHEMILRLPAGYDTQLGGDGLTLSSGQKQRIGLARTMFGDPMLIVLDEPNANLDTEGEQALFSALIRAKARNATIILISHRVSAFQAADKMLVLLNGQVRYFGTRDDVLSKLSQNER